MRPGPSPYPRTPHRSRALPHDHSAAPGHPHLTIVPVRGNADTRLRLARIGDVDAVILALAGLRRLGREAEATEIIDTDRMMPALGAGQLALHIRADDQNLLDLVTPLADATATRAALAERTLLRALAGHCHAPIAGHATTTAVAGDLHLAARVYTPDGSQMLAATRTGPDPQAVGHAVAQDLIAQGANDLLASSRRS
ncbi:hypothetical protein ACFV2Q_19795 [Streptomyces sp. NPDC059650]|uniref:hypothetical protein n=1 Tax=Streptomyces sp. NPDC059650 TaxID=3346896 RepID=UPI00368A4549